MGLVIGFDPGLQITGYGVIDPGARPPRLVEAGVIRVPVGPALTDRLDQLYRGAVELLVEHRPAAAAVEDLFSHYARPRTAILMGHARGAILLAAAHHGVPVASYLPTKVKKLLTGSGRASKGQMQRAVQTEFGLSVAPEPADVADALAIALCHYHAGRRAG